jgi:hypothetical protein
MKGVYTESSSGLSVGEESNCEDKGKNPGGQLKSVHPFLSRWDFWGWRQEEGKEWADSVYRQCSVESIEDLWALLTRIKKPTHLKSGRSISGGTIVVNLWSVLTRV